MNKYKLAGLLLATFVAGHDLAVHRTNAFWRKKTQRLRSENSVMRMKLEVTQNCIASLNDENTDYEEFEKKLKTDTAFIELIENQF